MLDDDVAYGAAQVLFAVQDIMMTPEIIKYMPFQQRNSIYRHVVALENSLQEYRWYFQMTERRTPTPHLSVKDSMQQVKLATSAIVLTWTGVQTAGAVAADVSTGALVAGAVTTLGAGLFFNALDDSPKPRVYPSAYYIDGLRSSVTSLTQDFTDLQNFSSMAMTAEQAEQATVKELLDALKEAVNADNDAIVQMIALELLRRFPLCAQAIVTITVNLGILASLRGTVVKVASSGQIIELVTGAAAKTRAANAKLLQAFKEFSACIGANYR